MLENTWMYGKCIFLLSACIVLYKVAMPHRRDYIMHKQDQGVSESYLEHAEA